jgi:hypothetical protein
MRDRVQPWAVMGLVIFGLALSAATLTLFGKILSVSIILFCWYGVYVAAFFYSARHSALTAVQRRWVIGSGIAALLAVMVIPPPPGADVYHYLSEFSIWIHHAQNPFLVAPESVRDAFSVMSFWQELPSQHGPVLQFIGAPIIWLVGSSVVGALYVYKLILVAAVGLMWWLGVHITRVIDARRADQVLVLLAWSPLLTYDTAMSGGTDTLMVAALLLSIWLCSRRRWYLGAAALMISILIKYIPILIAPILLIYAIGQQPTLRKKWLVGLGSIGVAVGVGVLAFIPFWTGPEIFTATRWVASVMSASSLPGTVELFGGVWAPLVPWLALRPVWWVAFGIIYASIIIRLIRRQPIGLGEVVSAGGITLVWFLLIGKTWVFGKYFIWAVPLLLLNSSTALVGLAATSIIVFSPYNPGVFVLFWLPGSLFWATAAYLKSRWNGMITA